MSNEALTTYLNDHLAGSVAAIELLEHLVGTHKGTAREQFFLALRKEVEEDQTILQQLLRDVGGKESRVKKAAAWLAEKVGETSFDSEDPGSGELGVLEGLETLGLGIQGKLALWRALEAAAGGLPQIRRLDLTNLQRRAQGQFDRVEGLRLELAPKVLSSQGTRGKVAEVLHGRRGF